ncbi:DUF4265 domain-containing protein [Streptomyces sp. NPDC056549]|uniref:DUF4265 domain-containing protein n=1 Tax=Streptomyces sp. NPDC056549 TaxID=3345864 RepID=UPI0036BDF420
MRLGLQWIGWWASSVKGRFAGVSRTAKARLWSAEASLPMPLVGSCFATALDRAGRTSRGRFYSAAARQSVLEILHKLGTTGEGIERYRIVALDVPPEADLPRILKLLERGTAESSWPWG